MSKTERVSVTVLMNACYSESLTADTRHAVWHGRGVLVFTPMTMKWRVSIDDITHRNCFVLMLLMRLT